MVNSNGVWVFILACSDKDEEIFKKCLPSKSIILFTVILWNPDFEPNLKEYNVSSAHEKTTLQVLQPLYSQVIRLEH